MGDIDKQDHDNYMQENPMFKEDIDAANEHGKNWGFVFFLMQCGVLLTVGGAIPFFTQADVDNSIFYAAHVSGACAILLLMLPPQWLPFQRFTSKVSAFDDTYTDVEKDEMQKSAEHKGGDVSYKVTAVFATNSVWMVFIQMLIFSMEQANNKAVQMSHNWIPVIALVPSFLCVWFVRLRLTLMIAPFVASIPVLILLAAAATRFVAGPAHPCVPDPAMNETLCLNNQTIGTNVTELIPTTSLDVPGTAAIGLIISLPVVVVFFVIVVLVGLAKIFWVKTLRKLDSLYFELSFGFAVSLLIVAFWMHGDRWDSTYSGVGAHNYMLIYLIAIIICVLRIGLYRSMWRTLIKDTVEYKEKYNKRISVCDAFTFRFCCRSCQRVIKERDKALELQKRRIRANVSGIEQRH